VAGERTWGAYPCYVLGANPEMNRSTFPSWSFWRARRRPP
jgi:hypothetical protein